MNINVHNFVLVPINCYTRGTNKIYLVFGNEALDAMTVVSEMPDALISMRYLRIADSGILSHQ